MVILTTFKTPATAKQVDATLKEKILQMDFLGTALVMGASLTLLLAIEYGGVTHPWRSSLVIGLLVGCFVGLELGGLHGSGLLVGCSVGLEVGSDHGRLAFDVFVGFGLLVGGSVDSDVGIDPG